jgi:hypothetical protein
MVGAVGLVECIEWSVLFAPDALQPVTPKATQAAKEIKNARFFRLDMLQE